VRPCGHVRDDTPASGRVVESVAEASPESDRVNEPRTSRIDRHTRDFVLETLHQRLMHQEFEEFTADLLRAMGYQASAAPFRAAGRRPARDAGRAAPPLP
jgi:restriction system protein